MYIKSLEKWTCTVCQTSCGFVKVQTLVYRIYEELMQLLGSPGSTLQVISPRLVDFRAKFSKLNSVQFPICILPKISVFISVLFQTFTAIRPYISYIVYTSILYDFSTVFISK